MNEKRRRKRSSVKKPESTWRFSAWFESKAPLLRFCFKFLAALGVLYSLSLFGFYDSLLSFDLSLNARLAGWILRGLGENCHVIDVTLWNGSNAVVTVRPACAGMEVLAFFAAAVIAYPVPWSRRIPGLVIGIGLLLMINLARVAILYDVLVHFPAQFALAHERLAGVVLILATVTICAGWISWAQRTPRLPSNAAL